MCHGVDTDKSTEIEHTWMHADTNTQAEETHTERHFQLRCKPTDRILYSSCFVDFKHIVWSCLKNDKTLKTQLKEGGGNLYFITCLEANVQTHIPTHTPTYMFSSQPKKPQPKLLLLPAADPFFLMNAHWLPKGTLLAGNAASSPSFHICATAYTQ